MDQLRASQQLDETFVVKHINESAITKDQESFSLAESSIEGLNNLQRPPAAYTQEQIMNMFDASKMDNSSVSKSRQNIATALQQNQSSSLEISQIRPFPCNDLNGSSLSLDNSTTFPRATGAAASTNPLFNEQQHEGVQKPTLMRGLDESAPVLDELDRSDQLVKIMIDDQEPSVSKFEAKNAVNLDIDQISHDESSSMEQAAS